MNGKKTYFILKKKIFIGCLVLLPCWAVAKTDYSYFEGEWAGSMYAQSGSTKNNIFIKISNTSPIEGYSEYSELGCRGKLTLLKETDDSLRFIETIKEGKGKCTEGAKIVLEKREENNLYYLWHYPEGALGLQVKLVKQKAIPSNMAIQTASSSPSSQPTSNTSNTAQSSQDSDRDLALRYLEDMAAHPDDPQNPPGVEGVSDEELASVPYEEIEELFAMSYQYAYEEPIEARHIFALGRAAYLHDDEEFALELLKDASEKGSAAAYAYLAMLTDDSESQTMKKYLQKSVRGGFAAAKPWLAEVEDIISEQAQAQAQSLPPPPIHRQKTSSSIDYSYFNQPNLIKAFYNQNAGGLGVSELEMLTYINSVQELFMDQSSVLFITSNPGILREPDPNLGVAVTQKMVSSNAMGQAMDMGMQNMMNLLEALAGAHRNNSSPMQGAQDMINSQINTKSSTMNLVALKNQATQDARLLVVSYDSNPEFLRRVYQGMRKYVYELR